MGLWFEIITIIISFKWLQISYSHYIALFFLLDSDHGGDSACTPANKCGKEQGDCDKDDDCKDGLKCGTDNCGMQRWGDWEATDDCCVW